MFEPIRATWTFSSEELEAYWGTLSRRASVHRKQSSHGPIVLVAVLVSCAIAGTLAPAAGLLCGLLCFVVVMLFWTVVDRLSKMGDARVARQWARVIMASGPGTVEITQTHLRVRDAADGVDSKIKWSRVADVGSTSVSLIIWLNDFQGILLPTRAFHPTDVARILALWSSVKLARASADVPSGLVPKDGPSSSA